MDYFIQQSKSATFSTSFSSSSISGNWGDVLDSTDFDAITSNSSKGGLGSWSGGFVSSSSSCSKPDVNCGDFELLESVNDINCGKHSCVG